MDESSEAHMETDVSSTTIEDVLETQEVTGSHGDVEMVIVVEKVEEDSSTDVIDKHPLESDISNASGNVEPSPPKVSLRLPQKFPKIPPVTETNMSQTALKPPVTYESPMPVDQNQVSIAKDLSPINQQQESSDSSTKIEPQMPLSLNAGPQISVTSKMSPGKEQPISSDSSNILVSKPSQISMSDKTSLVNEQSESSNSNSIKIETKISNSLNKTSQISVTNKTSPVKQASRSSNTPKLVRKTNNISVTNTTSALKQQTEPTNSSKFLSKTVEISVTNKTNPMNQQLVCSDGTTKIVFKKSPEKITGVIGRSPTKISQDQKIIPKSPFKDVKVVTRSPIKLIRIREMPANKETKTQVNLPAQTTQAKEKTEDLTQNSNKEPKSTENIPINAQENQNKQVLLPESSLTKKEEQSNMVEKSEEKSPTKDKLVEPAPDKDIKVIESSKEETKPEQSVTNVKSLHSTEIVLSEASISDNSNSISQISDHILSEASHSDKVNCDNITDHDTSISNVEPAETVNGDDKIDLAPLPADDTLSSTMNESQSAPTDVVEKEHNKSISRELKSLIKSAKDSKIISECTQLKTKTRKSRQLDASNTSLNASIETEKVGFRRSSTNSLVSDTSEKSDRSSLKRSMRSQNPEFVNKCKQFLNSVTSRVTDMDEPMSEDEGSTTSKEKSVNSSKHDSPTPKKKKVDLLKMLGKGKNTNRSDFHCWRCHWIVEQDNDKAHPPLECTVCPRTFHYKCLSTSERKTPSEKKWVCPDCLQILQAEGSDTRSPAMKKTSLGMLCELLKYALERMMDLNGVEPFIHPVDRTLFPDYDKYVVHPMDLMQMKQNIADGLYGSTEAFVADAQWILHNSIIFNTLHSKLTGGARALVRSCRSEMGEIEACPECYASAHARKPTWFTDVCSTPHILLWAKLKGFPYWPAKGMTVNSSSFVDVRFFGAHDRAWVPAKDCFLFSEKDPNNFRNKRQDILDSMKEAEQHIRNISRKYGKFVYPPFKTQFDPSILTEQLKMMIPSFEGEIKMASKEKASSASPLTTAKETRRPVSQGSKSSANDDGSESEDTSISSRTELLKRDKERKENENEKAAKVDSRHEFNVTPTQVVETIATRKRRRSCLEEAVMTVIETSTTEKRKRIDSTDRKKLETPEPIKRDSVELRKKSNSTELRKKSDSTEHKKRSDSIDQKKKRDSLDQKKQEQQEPCSSKEEKFKLIAKEMEVTETKSKKKTDKNITRDEEPSSSTMEERESLRVTPIKLVALPRANKQTPKMFAATKVPSKVSSPKEDDRTPQRAKSTRSDKASTTEKAKEDKTKPGKRRNSKSNKSQSGASTPKSAKTDRNENEDTSKELRPREKKTKDGEASKFSDNSLLKPTIQKEIKDRLQFDDDTSLAVIAQKRRPNNDGLPTISSVCSLSTTANASSTTNTTTTSPAKSIEITVVASSNSNIFTPTSTENVRNMKEAASQLQNVRHDTEPVVGRVGVRAFARMTSPEPADNVQVEIKAEPIDLDDEERHNEKMDLMNACNLQPVNQPQNLRDVRINRVVVGPSYVVKSGKVEARARAKKSFPTPRRAEGSSELNGKNSMVYIPIQPPATQAPVRPLRPTLPAGPRPTAPLSAVNNTVNTMTTPLKPTTSLSSPSMAGQLTVPTAGQVSVPTVGQVATTVHTVPLMTSVNGQWMFSLQPVMSVGGVDNATSPIVNGISDRGATPILSTNSTTNSASAPSTPSQQNKTNDTPAELPRLQQRPTHQNPLDPNSAPVSTPTPSSAGPITAKLNQNAVKLADFFRTLLEDSIEKLDDPNATATSLKKQLEQARWRHQHELNELKHNHELTLAEMRLSFEKDKLRVIGDVKRASQLELDAAVKLAKSKQWCVNCTQEAQFYCCWNTSYCDYPCQRAHWPHHYASCAQRSKDNDESSTEPRLQPQPDNLPKNVPATPPLTVGGKLASSRVFGQQDAAQKASIIVSMVEDNSGNQTMKCVGTYKPAQQGQLPPLIINNKQVNDEGKKVVTSGGYLIVGSAGNTASVITPAPSRRHHAIQYFT